MLCTSVPKSWIPCHGDHVDLLWYGGPVAPEAFPIVKSHDLRLTENTYNTGAKRLEIPGS